MNDVVVMFCDGRKTSRRRRRHFGVFTFFTQNVNNFNERKRKKTHTKEANTNDDGGLIVSIVSSMFSLE